MRGPAAHQEMSGDGNQSKRAGTGEKNSADAELLRQISRKQKPKHLGHSN